MISEIEIYQTAKILLKQFPHRALKEAKRRSAVLASQGDDAGAELWSKVAEAVEWLQSKETPQDKTAH